MAELLELEEFDEKNLKARCPYHDEKTASFIYNKKDKNFHCFGCSTTVDIIDVLVAKKSMTFLDSVKWLFKKAEIEYQFGEQHVATRQKYKYPIAESYDNDRAQAYEYLAKRGIGKSVADYLDIRADSHGNIAFHAYDENDVLTTVNYRKPYKTERGENKCWFQKDVDSADILWNMNRINPNKPLVITEGQIDCASVIQAGYTNAVSVLKGSGNLHWIENCWDWLEQFDEIIVASDNDKAGTKMRTEVISRLGAWRCKYVDIPYSLEFKDTGKMVPVTDLNEVLQCTDGNFLLDLINSAKDLPIASVAKLSEIEKLNPYEMEGFETGIEQLDNELMKIFVGGVTLITGLPSSGKTTFLNQLALMAMDNGFPTFLFSRELLNGMTTSWLNNVGAGRRNMREVTLKNGKKFSVVTDSAEKGIMEFYDEVFYVYRDEESNKQDDLFDSMEQCARKKGFKVFIIDNLMTVDLGCDEQGVNKAQTDFMIRLIKFSMKYNVIVICVAHPRKMPSGQEIGLFDVAGSSNIVNLATRTIGLKRVKEDNKMDMKHKHYGYDVCISVVKDRIFGSSKEIPVYYDKISRRFFSNYGEFDRRYKWDRNVYTDKLPYPIEAKEQFPDR